MSKKSEMKIVVSRDEVEMVVKRASLAAMTEEGQSEISRASNETRGCIKITAKDGKVSFDAGVSRFASRHVVMAGDGAPASIEADGEACVPAKEFKEIVSKIPSECRVVMSYSHQPPEPDPTTPESVRSLLPDGVLSIGAMRKDRVVGKAQVESYPSEHFSQAGYPEASSLKIVASGKASSIKGPCALIAFSINPNDVNELLNKVALFDGGDKVYFVGTDSRRCAIVPADKSTFDQSSDFGVEENGRPVPVLIDAEYLNPILSSVGDEDVVTISTDEAGEYLYLSCGGSAYRISRLDKTMAMKYPDYRRMLSMPIGPVITVDRKDCSVALGMLRPANKDRARYLFLRDENIVRMSSRGVAAIKSGEGTVPYKLTGETALKGDNICIHTEYFCQAIKQMAAEGVKISFSTDEMKLRVEDETDPKFLYFMQVMNPNEAA